MDEIVEIGEICRREEKQKLEKLGELERGLNRVKLFLVLLIVSVLLFVSIASLASFRRLVKG